MGRKLIISSYRETYLVECYVILMISQILTIHACHWIYHIKNKNYTHSHFICIHQHTYHFPKQRRLIPPSVYNRLADYPRLAQNLKHVFKGYGRTPTRLVFVKRGSQSFENLDEHVHGYSTSFVKERRQLYTICCSKNGYLSVYARCHYWSKVTTRSKFSSSRPSSWMLLSALNPKTSRPTTISYSPTESEESVSELESGSNQNLSWSKKKTPRCWLDPSEIQPIATSFDSK